MTQGTTEGDYREKAERRKGGRRDPNRSRTFTALPRPGPPQENKQHHSETLSERKGV